MYVSSNHVSTTQPTTRHVLSDLSSYFFFFGVSFPHFHDSKHSTVNTSSFTGTTDSSFSQCDETKPANKISSSSSISENQHLCGRVHSLESKLTKIKRGMAFTCCPSRHD